MGVFYHAQYDYFPKDQSPYKDGVENYYKDFHSILIEKGLKPCENKNEMHNFRIVIHPDSSIEFVKPADETYYLQNKCAAELAKEVAKYQNEWQPAIVNGEKVAAVASFLIYPEDLFNNYKENYNPYETMEQASYQKSGTSNFRQKVSNSIDLRGFNWSEKFTIIVNFVVERDGSITNIMLDQSSGLKNFDDMIIKAIKKIKNKWSPATIHNIPVRSHMRLPLTFFPK